MWTYNYSDELYHHGVLGMKWGHRTAQRDSGISGNFGKKYTVKDFLKENMVSEKKVPIAKHTSKSMAEPTSKAGKVMGMAKNSIKQVGGSELGKRGKSAIDVLMNGDSDWMGHKTYSDNSITEMKNRGKAAAERLLYSQQQIDNKKFFGRYDF